MAPEAITRRLRKVAELTDLRSERRLHPKLDLTPEGITARLRQASELQKTCARLARLRPVE